MSDRDDLPQAQIIDDRLQVTELLPEAVRRAGGLVGLPEPQEVERHDAPAGVDEMGNEIVVDTQIVGKPCMSTNAGSAPA